MSPLAVSPLPESSGDSEDFNVTSETPAVAKNLEPLALFIQNIATEQRKRQLCNFFSMCDGATNSLTMYNMELPQIRKKDKCFETNFQKSKIRERIGQQDKSNEQAFNVDQSSENDWNKQVAIHVILRNFALFMESTIRAIRFMN
ncbi:hypothetical protein scyTo_0015299 [Scyliorhinus torazame]|uniref:Interleukin-6 n=1 Tax=Scyliorhinus torazame TaxID=75743 RepID=A0A401PQB3_SCYTO|nr:hypothetical protein [Scyliorhinus torazame]